MTEKPLHVRVAEALGWTVYAFDEYGGFWRGKEPGGHRLGARKVPHYDTDWSATGPLIERLCIHLDPHGPDRADHGWAWLAYLGDDQAVHGSTPLLAVCHLILVLSEAGKLPR